MATGRRLQAVTIQPALSPGHTASRTRLGAPAAMSCGLSQQPWGLVLPSPLPLPPL